MEEACRVEEKGNGAAEGKMTVESPQNNVPLNREPKCNPANPISYLTGIAQGAFPQKDLSWVRVLCSYSGIGAGLKPDLRLKVWSTLLGDISKSSPSGYTTQSSQEDLSWDRRLLVYSYALSDEMGKQWSTIEGGNVVSTESLAMDIRACVNILLPKGGRMTNEAREACLPFTADACAFLLTLPHLLGEKEEEVKDQIVAILAQIFRNCELISPSLMSIKTQIASHEQFYFLASYHAPKLIQHLDVFLSGWELPLDDADRAIQSAVEKDIDAVFMLDELEQSIMPHLKDHAPVDMRTTLDPKKKRRITGSGHFRFSEEYGNHGVIPHSMLGVLCLNLLRLGCSPSMLAKLWDYLIISGSKYKGYFLLLALLLREKKQLLALEGEELQLYLKGVLNGSGFLSSLQDGKLDTLLIEAWDLDLQTPQSFIYFVTKAILQVAEEEDSKLHENISCFTSASHHSSEPYHETSLTEEGGPASPSPLASSTNNSSCSTAQMDGASADFKVKAAAEVEDGVPPSVRTIKSTTSLFSNDSEDGMNLSSVFVVEPKACQPQSSAATVTTSTEGVTAEDTAVKAAASRGGTVVSRMAKAASQAVIRVRNQRKAIFGKKIGTKDENHHPSCADDNEVLLPHSVIPQICLYITPHEMLMSIGLKIGSLSPNKGTAPFDTTPSDRTMPHDDIYFPIDCRSQDARSKGGWFKDVFHLDPENIRNPNVLPLILKELQPVQGNKHICLMGGGEKQPPPHYEEDGKQQLISRDIEEENIHVHACALFLMKHGFKYVSIVLGGFAAAHRHMASEYVPGMGLSILTDHSPSLCDLCECDAVSPRPSERPNTKSTGRRNFFPFSATATSPKCDSTATIPLSDELPCNAKHFKYWNYFKSVFRHVAKQKPSDDNNSESSITIAAVLEKGSDEGDGDANNAKSSNKMMLPDATVIANNAGDDANGAADGCVFVIADSDTECDSTICSRYIEVVVNTWSLSAAQYSIVVSLTWKGR